MTVPPVSHNSKVIGSLGEQHLSPESWISLGADSKTTGSAMLHPRDTTTWHIVPSASANNTINPIRRFVENSGITANSSKSVINLSIGDPTVFGNLEAPPSVSDAVTLALTNKRYRGYAPSVGFPDVRRAIAEYYSKGNVSLTENDVIITSGCSDALDMAMGVLANDGDNILIPCPGFSLYQTVCTAHNIQYRCYKLLENQQYEADLQDMESKIDNRTVAILVNNPSNPCGSVYSEKHLLNIIAIAEKYKLPIIADEIYEWNVFHPNKFVSMASLTTVVPILTCSGIAKAFIVPGWRVGWILIHDRQNIFQEIRKGLVSLSQLILGANTLMQAAIPDILKNTPQTFFDETNALLQNHAEFLTGEISTIPGLLPIAPQGALYMMVLINMSMFNDIQDDIDFVKKLMSEESVFCIPGQVFLHPNCMRLTLMPPKEQLASAMLRLREFCQRHRAS